MWQLAGFQTNFKIIKKFVAQSDNFAYLCTNERREENKNCVFVQELFHRFLFKTEEESKR